MSETHETENVSYSPMKVDYKLNRDVEKYWNDYCFKQTRNSIFHLARLFNLAPYKKTSELGDEEFSDLLKTVVQTYLDHREEYNDKIEFNQECRKINNLAHVQQIQKWKSLSNNGKARLLRGHGFRLRNKREMRKREHLQKNKANPRHRHRRPKQERVVRAAARNAILDKQVSHIEGTD